LSNYIYRYKIQNSELYEYRFIIFINTNKKAADNKL